MKEVFRRFSVTASEWYGSPVSFALHVLVSLYALIGGGETVVLLLTISTALVAILVLGAQIRGEKALHIKVDELLRAVTNARTGLQELEDKTEEELTAARAEVRQGCE